MGQFDETIAWMRKQLANAENELDEIQKGKTIEVNGEDVTDQWIVMYERLISRIKRLVEFYEKRNQPPEK